MKRYQFELQPADGRKSFYGKAIVTHYSDGLTILKSYDTDVCYITPDGNFIRAWNGWSATTQRHIVAFTAKYDIPSGGKSWWMSLPVGPTPDRLSHDVMVLETITKTA